MFVLTAERKIAWRQPCAAAPVSPQLREGERHLANIWRSTGVEAFQIVECGREDQKAIVTGENGRAVLEVMLAACESARVGRKVKLPFRTKAKKPVDLWLGK